jgi:transposase
MSYRDQVKYLETLQRFERKMNPKEKEELKMFVKRQIDEEEFDSVSMKRLKELYDKYNIPVDRSKYDSFFKKIND